MVAKKQFTLGEKAQLHHRTLNRRGNKDRLAQDLGERYGRAVSHQSLVGIPSLHSCLMGPPRTTRWVIKVLTQVRWI